MCCLSIGITRLERHYARCYLTGCCSQTPANQCLNTQTNFAKLFSSYSEIAFIANQIKIEDMFADCTAQTEVSWIAFTLRVEPKTTIDCECRPPSRLWLLLQHQTCDQTLLYEWFALNIWLNRKIAFWHNSTLCSIHPNEYLLVITILWKIIIKG